MSGDAARDAGADRTLTDGRYLYCIVRASEGAAFEATGIDGGEVSLVTVGDVGAVVQPCDEPFDSDDLTQIRAWLLDHQTVVDEATEAFGTPLPVRFDTVLDGGDEGVREWLRDSADELGAHLDAFAGRREYRVRVVRTGDEFDEGLADDDRLRELETKIEEAGEGTAHLLRKQYDRRMAELRRVREGEVADELRSKLRPHVEEMEDLGGRSVSLGDAAPAEDTVARVAVLAALTEEDELGAALDDVAATPGVEVRFTGPWPPYTFAPEVG